MKEIGRYVESFKKFVRWYLKGDRIDVEWIDKEDKRDDVFWFGGDFVVLVEGGWVRIEWREEGDVECKEELYKVLGMGDEKKVLNCGKVGEKWVGISSLCCCIWYDEGKEKWSMDDFGWFEKFSVNGKWFEREGEVK